MKQNTQTIGFFILLALAGLVVIFIFWPFWELLAFAIILAVLFYPLYKRIQEQTKMPNMSAGFVVFIMALIIAGPVLLIGQQVFSELVNLYRSVHLEDFSSQADFVQRLPVSLRQMVTTFNLDLFSWTNQLLSRAVNSVSGILSSLVWFFGSLVVVVFSVFFLLRDGAKIKQLLSELLPLSKANENILFDKVSLAVNGVVKGQFIIALIQAFASFVGFVIFGVPNALLWACLVLLAAFIPTFGTGLVVTPAVIYLYLSGHTGPAVGLAIWGSACVGLIDNVLSAKLISSKVRLHPLLVIFAILGGVVSFGVFGVLLGPILMAIFVALVEIYRTDIKKN